MPEKDIVEKILEDYPEVFADIVNVQINVFSIAWMSEEEISRFRAHIIIFRALPTIAI